MSVQDAIQKALEAASTEHLIAYGKETSTADMRWANNSMTTNGVTSRHSLRLIAIDDGKVSSLGTSHFPPDRIQELVRRCEEGLKDKEPAEDRMPLVEGSSGGPDWGEQATATSIEAYTALAKDLGKAFREAEAADQAHFGFAEHSTETTWLATSTGVQRRHSSSEGRFEFNLKSQDFSRSAWSGQVTKDFSDVDFPEHHHKLTERLEASKERIDLPPGHYEVLLEPSCVADMLIYAYWSASARDADEGRSAYSKPGGGNRIGELIADPSVNLRSDPDEKGMSVPNFVAVSSSSAESSVFDNGASIEPSTWISDGKLNSLITTRHWAERSGGEVKQSVDNLILESSGPQMDEMIASTERALLVNCLWYIRMVDPQSLLLTGLTRDGVYLVEDGKIRGAVNNFRFNMSPLDMLQKVTEMGESVLTLAREFGDYFLFSKTPPIRVRDWNMSSVSQAT